MFARDLIESVTLDGRRLTLGIRLNWYRSLPLNCLQRLEVSLDGWMTDGTTIGFAGHPMPLWAVAQDVTSWWSVRDTLQVTAELADSPSAGAHTVAVLLGNRIPYLIGPDDQAVVIVDRCRREVTA